MFIHPSIIDAPTRQDDKHITGHPPRSGGIHLFRSEHLTISSLGFVVSRMIAPGASSNLLGMTVTPGTQGAEIFLGQRLGPQCDPIFGLPS